MRSGTQATWRPWWIDKLAGFFPGYFSFVMATGIVSLALHFQGREALALALFGLNLLGYLVLWVITIARFARWPQRVVSELTHHSQGAAFLTTAAGTSVLGAQFALLTSWNRVAGDLWLLGAGLCLVLSYTFFTALTVREPKPSLSAGIKGSWLLVVVATESISVLGTLVAPTTTWAPVLLFIALAAFLAGAMLYVFFATLILYRWMFFRMRPEKLTPDYWIDMGALAITAVAGALLLQADSHWSMLPSLTSFLTGALLFFWATATWWIPLLCAVELWRHLCGHVPFRYDPDYWAMVFPLGMYAVATFKVVRVTGLVFLTGLADFFTDVALAIWAIVLLAMLHHLLALLRSRTHTAHAHAR